IGRWLVARLLADGHEVLALDDLSSGRQENLEDLQSSVGLRGLCTGDVKDAEAVGQAFQRGPWDAVFHLAASINVQGSIDDPETTIRNDIEGTFVVLQASRKQYFELTGLDPESGHCDFDRDVPRLRDRRPRVAVMSTCMVYDAAEGTHISESPPDRTASHYSA